MSFVSLRKYWILLISISVMLTASVASSQTMMTFNMISGSASQQHHCGTNADKTTMALTLVTNDCQMSDGDHRSCDSVCANVFALIPPTIFPTPRSTQIILKRSDKKSFAFSRSSSLYRPPIA
ncbi:hypothetical protein ACODM8_16940 [Vibrio ostreicida]|uniref:DUF2946 domain-containing protein n=1 Tax=Vibrio ostreicida TaxID=526588 RepID=A0ABT8BXU5_9VIBR|nr:hypothetical protein [Vibrio ostreicida]MDN3612002.1 hypothetical protein [Vibrio ostreicida]NPD08824.1 hypothetical protein [Vibrio ostreicida]